MTTKRKNETPAEEDTAKKQRMTDDDSPGPSTRPPQAPQEPASSAPTRSSQKKQRKNRTEVDTPQQAESSNSQAGSSLRKEKKQGDSKPRRIRKLTPARPWPIVPTSVSATGPRSAHKEGKNYICLSRRTSLGAYMRRCKDVIIKDGYKTLHLSAMGAAVPLLLQLTCALPPILPFAKEEIETEITTQTCEVQDEVLPDDDDEDISIQQRSKSTLRVVITIGDGKFEGDTSGPLRNSGKNVNSKARSLGKDGGGSGKGKSKADQTMDIVYAEPEQEELMETI